MGAFFLIPLCHVSLLSQPVSKPRMTLKTGIFTGIGVLVLIFLIVFGLAGAGVASEAKSTEALLVNAKSQHLPQADIDAKLKAAGWELTETPTVTTGRGPVHSALVMSVRLACTVNFDAEGKTNGYRLDRE